MNALSQSIATLIQKIDTSGRAAETEIELRVQLAERAFETRFAECTQRSDVAQIELHETVSRSYDLNNNAKLRIEMCARDTCVLSSVEKRRIIRPLDFASNVGRLRVDAQLEVPAPAAPLPFLCPVHERTKSRISTRFNDAIAWRIDFTRVDVGAVRTYELELELDRGAIPDASATELGEQAARVLKRLKIFII